MIVKDEAEVIERCIEAVKPLISSWVICDTGSCDGTQDLVRQSLAGVPGELIERPWVDFGHNRTELMEMAQGKADYLLLVDADMTISFDPGGLTSLTADAYMLRHAEPLEYRVRRLVRGDRRWRYVGATHEYIESDGPETVANLDAIVIHHHGDGGTRSEKFGRDLALLQRELSNDPGNARAMFYLAQTYRDIGETDQAIAQYARRAEAGGWEEEVFYARFQIGVLKARGGDWNAAVPALLDAWSYRPSRIEPLYHLAVGYRERGAYEPAYLFALRGLDRRPPDDILFVEPWIYRWGMLFEYSIASYYAGDVAGALRACDRLLRRTDLPAAYRQQTVANRRFCLKALGRSEDPPSFTLGGRRVTVTAPAADRKGRPA